MGTLSRSGYIVNDSVETKKELTVRPIASNDFGFPPPPFKVFKVGKSGTLCVPRFYGLEKFGPPKEDKRPEPSKMARGLKFTGTLRDATSQNEALAKGLKAQSGVLSLPCGYGKTTVALALACKLGLRTMIIVHKEFLANQWRERIQQFCPGATIGIIQQDRIEIDGCDFVVAMLQSLSMKEYSFEQFESIGTVFVDEAHHICARVFSQSLFKMCPKHIFGLSATPDRKDGLTKVLNWFMGPTFFSIERENQQQVEVVPIQFDCPSFKDMPPTTRFGKISLVNMITELVENGLRNDVIVGLVKKILKSSRQLLVLSDRRLHCEYLASQFPEVSGLYMGGMKEKDLEISSKKRVIFGTFSQAHEGLDIPTLDTVILATPKSDIKQSIGRIMRESGGHKQNHPMIYDMVDQWSLLHAMYNKRKKVYVQGGFKIIGLVADEEPEENPFKGKCIL